MKRPAISPKMKVDVALEQAGGWVYCPLCAGPLRPEHPRILEHMVPHKLGGDTDTENLRWVHKECAATKTNGNKATSAGGDLHKIAKAKRLAKARDEMAAVIAGEKQKTPGKIKSRPFQGHRKFNGSIVRK
jgi:hypothetical protein